MTFSWSSLIDPQTWGSGLGGAALGLVTGHFRTNRGRISKLEKEVQECRARDADFHVIKAGFRLLVGAMVRDDPNSIELKMCGDLLARKLGPAPSIDDFATLVQQADNADPEEWTGPRRDWAGDKQ